jgi:RHS repeat-associated protein
LRKTVKNSTGVVKETRDYVNGVEYKDRLLERVAHSEGAVVRNAPGQYQHEYVLRDHLGNTRVTFRDGVYKGEPYWNYSNYTYVVPDNTGYNDGVVTTADIQQIHHTYPFGMAMEGNWNSIGSAGNNQYLYNGKQYNDDFGLGEYDYGARWYDPSIARWGAVDPLAEARISLTGYQYVQNNPMNRMDPTGMIDEDLLRKGKSPITEHNDHRLDDLRNKKSFSPNLDNPQNVLMPYIAGNLWGRGNIFSRAWTWLKSGGKLTMDSHGDTYGKISPPNVKGITQTQAFVENNSSYTVWCKPEEGNTPFSIAAGGRHLAPIDGFCIPDLYCNAVYKVAGGTKSKVIGGFEFNITISFRVIINKSGEVEVYNQVGQSNGINEMAGGGWKYEAWLRSRHVPTKENPEGDRGWDELFSKSNERCK